MATWKDVLKNVNSEIGRILHFESEMSKFLIGLAVQFEISDLGFEMQDSSNFKMSPSLFLSERCECVLERPIQLFKFREALLQNRSQVRQINGVQCQLHALTKGLHRIQRF